MPLTRRYEVAGLTPTGEIEEFNRVAPATAEFEDAFAGFARGTMISTAEGPVAIEDLVPGMMIETIDNGMMPLQWVGSMMVFPGFPDLESDSANLTRVTVDSFGMARPMHDLILGPRARILFRHGACQSKFGAEATFAPARAFIDGDTMISVRPITPVRVYHLALKGQQIIKANGVEVESFHPGEFHERMMDPTTAQMFLGLFPHVTGWRDFGTMEYPRLTAFEMEELRAA